MNTNEPTHTANNAPTRRRNASVWSHRSVFKAIRMLVAAVVLLCLPTAGIAAKLLIDWARNWWADRKARVASTSIAVDDETKARTSLAAAMQASPTDPSVLRAWAAYLKKYGGSASERVSILKKLTDLAAATTEDHAELAIALVETGAFEQARQIIESLPRAMRESSQTLEAQAALIEASGDRDAADALRRKVWESDLSVPRNRLKLAALNLRSRVPETRAQAIAELWKLAGEDRDTGLEACRILAVHPSLSRPQADELTALVKAHPKAAHHDRLLALSGVLRAQPEKREALLDAEIAGAADYGLNDLLALVVMLDREREFERLLLVVPLEKARKSRELCIMRIKALFESGHFSELEVLLTEEKTLPISTGHASAVLAHVRLQQGRASESMGTLRQALQQAVAQKDVETARRVAGFAEGQGWWDISSKSHEWLAASEPALRLSALQGLYKAAAAQLDTSGMLDATERLVQCGSQHVQVLSNLAYLRLLTGSQIESVPLLLEKLHKHEGAGFAALQTVRPLLKALLCYRYADVEGVRSNISSIRDWSLVPPGKRAVAATLYQYCGETAAAVDLAAQVRVLGLLAEEKGLWNQVQKSAATASAN